MEGTPLSAGTKLLSAAACISLVGSSIACFTPRVISRAKTPHYIMTPILHVSSAHLSNTSVFITMDAKPIRDSAPSTFVVEMPFELTAFAVGSEEVPLVVADGILLHHLSSQVLRAGARVPEDALPLTVHTLSTDNLADVTDAAHALGSGVHVISITYLRGTIGDDAGQRILAPEVPDGPMLAIVSTGDDGEATPFVVADVHKRTKHHRAWLLLTPLAVVGDIIASPVYLAVLLANLPCAN